MFPFMKKNLSCILVDDILLTLSVARLGRCRTPVVGLFARIFCGLNCKSV